MARRRACANSTRTEHTINGETIWLYIPSPACLLDRSLSTSFNGAASRPSTRLPTFGDGLHSQLMVNVLVKTDWLVRKTRHSRLRMGVSLAELEDAEPTVKGDDLARGWSSVCACVRGRRKSWPATTRRRGRMREYVPRRFFVFFMRRGLVHSSDRSSPFGWPLCTEYRTCPF